MRTQILILTAALGVAGASTTMAQVYSVNAVGYVNTPLKAGFNLIGNPLDNKTSNKVKDLLAGVDEGTTVYKWVNGDYEINNYDTLLNPDPSGWALPDQTLVPGEGAWVLMGAAKTVTFVGEVMQGVLTTSLPAGFSLVASKVPQAGKLSTDLKFPQFDGTTVYFWRNNDYDIYGYDEIVYNGWGPSEPSMGVGEACWVLAGPSTPPWVRDFSVNN